jgi:hypothetical protein
MDSEDEMIVQMMEDEQAFDDDLREHLSIIVSLQTCLTPTRRRRRGHAVEFQSREERVEAPAQDGGHTMPHNDYFANGAT